MRLRGEWGESDGGDVSGDVRIGYDCVEEQTAWPNQINTRACRPDVTPQQQKQCVMHHHPTFHMPPLMPLAAPSLVCSAS